MRRKKGLTVVRSATLLMIAAAAQVLGGGLGEEEMAASIYRREWTYGQWLARERERSIGFS
jgi:hypothetical protein